VQRLFAQHAGDTYVPTVLDAGAAGAKLAASTVRDSRSSETLIKVVNGDASAQSVTVRLAGGKLPAHAERIVFGGADADTVNTDGVPPAVMPRTETVPLSAEFTYEAPPNSLTIWRISGR
jgi:alpha-L-arabinofuranosidase